MPIIPGCTEPLKDADDALEKAVSFGFPVILKAAAGGGGRGMRRCDRPEEVRTAYELVHSRGGEVAWLRRHLHGEVPGGAKHIEVQILADNYGNVFHLGERDCSPAPVSEGGGVRPPGLCRRPRWRLCAVTR